MRYVSTAPLEMPLPMGAGEDNHPASLAEVVHAILSGYTPTQAVQLGIDELRRLNKILDVLEGDEDSGFYALEDEEFNTATNIITNVGPLLSVARNVPVILDALSESPSKKP